jgi:hypothetical protein
MLEGARSTDSTILVGGLASWLFNYKNYKDLLSCANDVVVYDIGGRSARGLLAPIVCPSYPPHLGRACSLPTYIPRRSDGRQRGQGAPQELQPMPVALQDRSTLTSRKSPSASSGRVGTSGETA